MTQEDKLNGWWRVPELSREELARIIIAVGKFKPDRYGLNTPEELVAQVVAGQIKDIDIRDVKQISFYPSEELGNLQLVKLVEFARWNHYQLGINARFVFADGGLKRSRLSGYENLKVSLKREKGAEPEKEPKRLVPTEFRKLVYRFAIDPVTADLLYRNLKASYDVEATIEGFKKFLDAARLFGIKKEHFLEGSYSINALEYRQINDVPIKKPIEFFSHFLMTQVRRQLTEFCPAEFHKAIIQKIVEEFGES